MYRLWIILLCNMSRTENLGMTLVCFWTSTPVYQQWQENICKTWDTHLSVSVKLATERFLASAAEAETFLVCAEV